MSPTAGTGANTALKGAALLVKILGEEGILKESIGKYEVSMREFAGEAIEKSGTGGKFLFNMRAWEELNDVVA